MAKNTQLPGVGKVSRLALAGEHFSLDKEDRRYSDPVRACEVCGDEHPSSDMMNYISVIGSPGHHSLVPFQHPEQEHWACSLDCWTHLHQRVGEEMRQELIKRHLEIGESIHHEEAKKHTASAR